MGILENQRSGLASVMALMENVTIAKSMVFSRIIERRTPVYAVLTVL